MEQQEKETFESILNHNKSSQKKKYDAKKRRENKIRKVDIFFSLDIFQK